MRYALGVEYDGTRYSGWQRLSSHGEAGLPTVQATLEDALGFVADAPAAPGVPLEAKGQANPSGRDGLELARAYLDLGDHQAARTLLREVLLGRDPGAREEAARMLRELG